MLSQPEDILRLEHELIGCELHDGPCQDIAAAHMLLEALRREQCDFSGEVGRLDAALELLERANVELRRLIDGLQPLQLCDARLLTIIERLSAVNEMNGGPEIEWCLDDGCDELPNHLAVPTLRIVQECLANARRHSMATRVLVGISQDDRSLSIQVQDWGVGFDPDKPCPSCHGLSGIRQRASLLHGTVTIDSRPGEGTCILVELPTEMRHAPAGANPPSIIPSAGRCESSAGFDRSEMA